VHHRLSRITAANSVVRIANALADAKPLIATGTIVTRRRRCSRKIDGRVPRANRLRAGASICSCLRCSSTETTRADSYLTHRPDHSLAGLILIARCPARAAFEVKSVARRRRCHARRRRPESRSGAGAIGAVVRRAAPACDRRRSAAHPVLGKRPGVVRATSVRCCTTASSSTCRRDARGSGHKTNIRYVQDARAARRPWNGTEGRSCS
jgi:hypothetical protein